MKDIASQEQSRAGAPDAAVTDIYLLGCTEEDRALLRATPGLESYRLHELLPRSALRGVSDFHLPQVLADCERQLRGCDPASTGVVTFIDFPASEIMGLLNSRFGLRGPSLEGVLALNHKYWSRLIQAEAAPESVPPFAVFNPFDPAAFDKLALAPPLWIKPLNAFASSLGFHVRNREEFDAGAAVMREHLAKLSEPLDYFLERARVPTEIRRLGGAVALAEGIIGGRQCTLEGYVHEGEPRVYGIVDSIRESNRSSFARYQYPSSLPQRVQQRMIDIACRVMRRTGFDNSTFNMEFFYDERQDRTWLLEINPRLSQSHFALFQMVDGVSSQRVAFELVRGRRPNPPHRRGRYRLAAKCFLRSFAHGRVTRVPSRAELDRIAEHHPDVTITVTVSAGQHLDALEDQDSYSTELALVWLGADDQHALLEKWDDIRKRLHFEVDDQPVR